MEQLWLCGHMQLPRPVSQWLHLAKRSQDITGSLREETEGSFREGPPWAVESCLKYHILPGRAVWERPSSLLFKGSHHPSNCIPCVGSHSSGSGAGRCPGFDLQDRPSLTGWQTTPRAPRMYCVVGPTSATAYVPHWS